MGFQVTDWSDLVRYFHHLLPWFTKPDSGQTQPAQNEVITPSQEGIIDNAKMEAKQDKPPF